MKIKINTLFGLITMFLVVFGLSSCTDEKVARELLEDEGYTNISITGYSYFGCGRGDTSHTAFSATSQKGHRRSGVLCCGGPSLFGSKGCTVRWDH